MGPLKLSVSELGTGYYASPIQQVRLLFAQHEMLFPQVSNVSEQAGYPERLFAALQSAHRCSRRRRTAGIYGRKLKR
jgi:hypothetical protein